MRKIILALIAVALAVPAVAQTNAHHREKDEKLEKRHERRHDNRIFYAATPEEIDRIVEFVRSFAFDSDRLKAAKFSVSICPIAAEDLKPILDIFTFDDKKIAVLKSAYECCPNKRYFHRAIDMLTFMSSKDKVRKYIEDYEESLNR